jgi:hypothetical protein
MFGQMDQASRERRAAGPPGAPSLARNEQLHAAAGVRRSEAIRPASEAWLDVFSEDLTGPALQNRLPAWRPA